MSTDVIDRPTPKLDPYILAPRRQAYIQVVGKIWMPAVEAAQTYQLSDHDLETMEVFSRESVEEWLSSHAGDFQSITDCYARCGATTVSWEKEENEVKFHELMFGYEEG